MPEAETDPRFVVPWSSVATANFVGTMAAASRAFRPHDAAYADRCLEAARRSHAFLLAHPEEHRAEQSAFRTGGYTTPDDDERLWASAEVWESTGDEAARLEFEKRARAIDGAIEENFDWGNVANLGMLTYLFSARTDRDPALVAKIRGNLLAAAESIVAEGAKHGYARPLGTRYYWGCNGGVARQTVVLQAANRLSPDPRFTAASLDAVHHLFGRNPHGRSYVTGLGAQPPMHPHARRSAADDVVAPWPGYLVGGAHPKAVDWIDHAHDFRTNEIAINWNGALIYALAAFLEHAPQ
jgi:endoglucanase